MNRDPNWFAIFALASWPLLTLWLYHRYPIGRATVWTILSAYLLLPSGADIKFQGIPALDKSSIPNLAAFVGCVLVSRRFPRLWRRFGFVEILLLVLIVCPFITSQLNGDVIVIGSTVLPGVGIYDALSAAVFQFIFFVPFILGRQFLRSSADNADILRILVTAGLFYSIPMLFEIRMSPQLHTWIYGYFPSSFAQQMREGGFRPVVFLGHGLLVSFFAMTTVVASAALWRTQVRVMRPLPPAGVTVYLSIVLILCKSMGSLVIGAAIVPLTRWATSRMQVRVATILVTIALAYPLLRSVDFVPTTLLVEAAGSVSIERAASLKIRFDQEKALLERASERFWFGWGRFGRSRIYDDHGKDITFSDGHWIITMGTFGIIGFLAEFGLLTLPVLRAAAALKFAGSTTERLYLAALALIVAINAVDLLPNASIRPWTWLLAGALLGRAEALCAVSRHQSQYLSASVAKI